MTALPALLDHVAAGGLVQEPDGPADCHRHAPHIEAAERAGRRAPRAYLIVTADTDDPSVGTIDMSTQGMNKAALAYALREAADNLDVQALAEGDAPLPHGPGPRIADTLERIAAKCRQNNDALHTAYRAGLRVAARIARTHGVYSAPAATTEETSK
ncbi:MULTISPECIES: hypothetical protein [unclassified Streptomyces]|uniref:hypothetical protein n=1 Tax=unclassified Streptomyces TaxID=2593676 RepID=UPI003333BBD8